jgi:alpha-galactosidase
MAITWPDLGVSGEQRIRDLWRQRDLGSSGKGFEIEVPRHGVALIKLRK